MCAHVEAPYRDYWPRGCLPRSEAAMDRGLILPLYPTMNDGDVDRVAAALKTALAEQAPRA